MKRILLFFVALLIASTFNLTSGQSNSHLNFTAVNGSGTVRLVKSDNPYSCSFQYSTDNCVTWNDYTIGNTINLSQGATVFFKAKTTNTSLGKMDSNEALLGRYGFEMTGTIEAHGNVMSLLDASLARTSVPDCGFYRLFLGCSSLVTPPTLPATTIGKFCYVDMFKNCTNLVVPPELPATSLSKQCYSNMFKGCTGLAYPPALPAKNLKYYCYWGMFQGCTSMSLNETGSGRTWKIPSGGTTESGWGTNMFSGTSGTLQGSPTIGQVYYCQLPSYTVNTMVNDTTKGSVTSGGTYTVLDTVTLTATAKENCHFVNWSNGATTPTIRVVVKGNTTLTANFAYDPLNFTALSDSVMVKLTRVYNPPLRSFQYSTDGCATWIDYMIENEIHLTKGETVYFKATTANGALSDGAATNSGRYRFEMSGTIEAHGSVMSLLDATVTETSVPDYAFHDLFHSCNSLVTAPVLPATQLGDCCYEKMFKSCHNLVEAPELPATTMKRYCYADMFVNCTSLRHAPALNSMNLAFYCYGNMFENCSTLVEPPVLPATTTAEYCYYVMFRGCANLAYPPELPATVLSEKSYELMFDGCTLISLNETGTDNTWNIPSNATSAGNWGTDMFNGTSGTMQGQPNIGQVYYYQFPEYTVNATANDPAMGIVVGGGSYVYNDTVTLTAVAKPNHHFMNWSNGETTPTISFAVKGNTTLTANFVVNPDYLNFTAVGTTGMVKLITVNNNVPSCSFEYSTDHCATWNSYSLNHAINLTQGSTVYFKATTTNGALSSGSDLNAGFHRFQMSGTIMAQGSVMSLLDETLTQTSVPANAFFNLFYDCQSLVTAPRLPATVMAPGCYLNMFRSCASLPYPPELPATTLADSCYQGMFKDCSSITVNETGDGNSWNIPSGATPATDWGKDMFIGTSGTLLGAPNIGQIYYYQLPQYEVSVIANDTTMGSVAGGGTYGRLQIVTLTATSKPNHHFVNWSNGATTPTINIIVTKDTTLTANFAVNPEYLNFTAVNDSATVKLVKINGNPPSCSFKYSTDHCVTWRNYTVGDLIKLASGATVYFRATSTNSALANSSSASGKCFRFVMSGTIEANGNIMSLLNATLTQTSVPNNAFYSLFYDCASLRTAPSLPATRLGENCYNSLFRNCTGLTVAPELPADTMAIWCYADMFSGCTNLQYAPVLNSMNVAQGCYSEMFEGCAALTEAPVLPATTLADQCYERMFHNCSSIELYANGTGNTWNIPSGATAATDWGEDMFLGTGGTLQDSPVIGQVYYQKPIFTVNVLANDTSLGSVTGGGTFEMNDVVTLTATPNTDHHFVGWSNGETTCTINIVVTSDTTLTATFAVNPEYLHFTAVNDSAMVRLVKINGNPPACSFQYSTDHCATWNDYTIEDSINFASGATVYFKATTTNGALADYPGSTGKCYRFQMSGTIEAHGNIMSLLDATLTQTTVPNFAFYSLFNDCASLITAPSLPATKLGNNCYACLFRHCTGLTEAPELPADTMTIWCYADMFSGCTSLQHAPALNSMSLADHCYCNMFANCTSLAQTPVLPATTLAKHCYYIMFQGCTGLTFPPVLPATTLAGSCYKEMFINCTSMALYANGTGNTWNIPSGATAANNWGENMFLGTKGTLQGAPVIGQVYYQVPLFTVTALANDSSMGSVAGSGLYGMNDTVTLTATAKAGHHLVDWVNGETTPAVNIVVTSDTVFTANFVVNPTYLFEEYDTICQGDTLTWRNMTLTVAGVYRDSFRTVAYGADSVYQMTLTVNPSYFITETADICQGETYTWHSRALTVPGVYHDSLLTVNGCDSVYELTLTVNPTYLMTEAATICDGDDYVWHSMILTTAGVYYDSLLTVNGCDSVYELTLTVNPTYLVSLADTICDGTQYIWRGKVITEAGVYRDTLMTTEGCDSVLEIAIAVKDSYLFAESDSICQGGSISWRGRDLSVPGTYRDSFMTAQGCDSVYQMTLTVTSQFKFVDTETICFGDTFAWRGRTFTNSGVYYDSLVSVHGCDSIYKLNLTANPRYITPTLGVICEGDTFTWRGRVFTETGVYTDSFMTVQGCDSIYRLVLVVNRRYLVRTEDYICTGSVYNWHGRILTDPGTYFDTLHTGTGCDSVCILRLTQAVSYEMYDSMTICSEPLLWRGQTITMAGTYYDSLVAMTGCDSVYVMNVKNEKRTVTAISGDESMGYVSGGGIYDCGDEVTVTALAYENNRFVQWNNGSTSPTLNFNVYEDTLLIAYFEVVVGVDDVGALNLEVASDGGEIILKGAAGHGVMVYDAVGKMIARIEEAGEFEMIRISVAGVYILKVDNGQSLRVVVK